MKRLYRYIVGVVWIVLLGGAMVTGCSRSTEPEMNNSPEILSFAASPNFGYAPLGVLFSWRVSDPDGDPLTCTLDIDSDGSSEYTEDCTNGEGTFYYEFNSKGEYLVTLTVKDTGDVLNTSYSWVTVRVCKYNVVADDTISLGTRDGRVFFFYGYANDTLVYHVENIEGNGVSEMFLVDSWGDTLFYYADFYERNGSFVFPYDDYYYLYVTNTSYVRSKVYYVNLTIKECPSGY